MDILKSFTGFFRKSTPATGTGNEDFVEIQRNYYYRLTFNKDIELNLEKGKNKKSLKFPSGKVVVKKGDFVVSLGNEKFSGIELVRELASSDQITIDPLDIEVNTNYKISNLTVEKQTIKPYDSVKPDIVILPFSTRWKTSEALSSYNFLELQRNGQIQVERQNQEHEIQDRTLLKSFIDWWKKLITKDSDVTSNIKDDYFYQLYNTTAEDLELVFPSPNRKEKKPKTLPKKDGDKHDIQVFKGKALNLIGKQNIRDMYDNYLINLVPLDIEVNTNYKISNRTAQPLKIENYDKTKGSITIPPFGTQVMNSERLKLYDFLDMLNQDRIQIERLNQAYKFRDWIKLAPLIDWFKNLFTKDSDVIGAIKDNYYYRLYNKTEDIIELPFPPSRDASQNNPFILPKFSDPLKTQVLAGTILNAVGKKKILDMVNSNLVNFQPLDIKVDTNYIISNRTERRVGIMNYNKRDQFVIPPLGTRLINSDKLRWYDFLDWYWQDLIQIEPEDQAYISAGNLSRFWSWVKLLPGIVLVALAGFGLPLWIVYYFGDGAELLQSFRTGIMPNLDPLRKDPLTNEYLLNILGRVFQLGFICIASILPALFYYLFGRQQVQKLREKFFRDVLVLDPHLFSLSEAEAKYDTLLNSAFGSGSSTSPFAILLLIFSTALLVIGWTLTITPYGAMPTGDKLLINYFQINPQPLTLGFLGVYFFSINMIFRRYVRADLTPKTYASIIVRLLVSLVLVFTIGAIGMLDNPDSSNNTLKYTALAVAFMIGVFPEDGFRIVRDSARKVIGNWAGGGDEKYPLTELEGMNQYDQARLVEEGIENIENLAHHNLIELLAFTRIPTARLVDIFDQAILYLHLGMFEHESKSKSDKESQDQESPGKKLLKFLNSLGVRTATDLMEILKKENIENTTRSIEDANKLLKSEFKLNRLQTIEATFKDDEWLSFILNWRTETSKQSSLEVTLVKDPSKFYDSGYAIAETFIGSINIPNLKLEVDYDNVNVRKGPGIEYPIVEQLKKGGKLTGTRLHSLSAWVEFEPDKWCAITYNLDSYVKVLSSDTLNAEPVSERKDAIRLPSLELEVTNEFLRIRNTPETTGVEVEQKKRGDKIVGRQMLANSTWIEIGKNKWVALTFEGTQYLKFIDSYAD